AQHRYLHSFPTRRSSDLVKLADTKRSFIQASFFLLRHSTFNSVPSLIVLRYRSNRLVPIQISPKEVSSSRSNLCNMPSSPCSLSRSPSIRGSTLHMRDRKSTRLNSSHVSTSYAVFCLKNTT